MRARCPHLLSVDHEPIAVELGARAQPREIRPGIRLAHTERRGHVAAQDRHRPLPLLFVGAETEDRRHHDAEALRVVARVDPSPAHLLEMHELLEQRRVAPAELGRVARHQPTGIEQLRLPRSGPGRDVGARLRAFGSFGRVRGVVVQPFGELPPKRFDVGVERQSHAAPADVFGNPSSPSTSTARATTARCSALVPKSSSPAIARRTNSCRSFSHV